MVFILRFEGFVLGFTKFTIQIYYLYSQLLSYVISFLPQGVVSQFWEENN